MTSLNNIVSDKHYSKSEPEVLIELPHPKPISDDCTIIMNGHHNYGLAEEKYNGIIEVGCEEMEPFLNHENNHVPSTHKSDSITSSNSVSSALVSSNMFPLKESSVPSSADEDSEADAERESSTHLLQNQSTDAPSTKCLRNKPKLPSFKSSPSKRQASNDSHSHIQHQPLGVPQSTKRSHLCGEWTSTLQTTCCIFTLITMLGSVVWGLFAVYYLSSSKYSCSESEWWQRNIMYEIFPASFQDTDGDGFGDIKGIIERLDYIQNLSINVIRLNSIFSALDYPLEYEHVIDFSNIDPHLGRIEDFEELVKEVHSRGMYIILDMNPSVTSDQHTWAAHWLLHRTGRYEHFYINLTDEKEEPPLETNIEYTENGWPPPHRTFGNHLVLNWSNPLLQMEMRNVLELWLSIGIDGFYMKHVENLHINDFSHYLNVVHQWRFILDKYSVNSTHKVLMISQSNMEYLRSVLNPYRFSSLPSMVDLVDASVKLVSNGSSLNVGEYIEVVRKFWDQYSVSPTIIWHAGSAETMRLASRIGREANMAGLLLVSMLPGSISCFYGDEIGLQNSFDSVSNKVYRGGQLTPMQWTSGFQANFTSDDTAAWLPVHPSYETQNVETEQDKLLLFKTLVELKADGRLFPEEVKPLLVHSFITRLGGESSDKPQYQWYHNLCGLIVAKAIYGDCEFMYAGNFGSEGLSFSDDEECVGGNFVFSLYPWKKVDVIISTNIALKGKVELNQILLEPGDSVIGHLIT